MQSDNDFDDLVERTVHGAFRAAVPTRPAGGAKLLEQVVLDRVKAGVAAQLPTVSASLTGQLVDDLADQLTFRLTTLILAHQIVADTRTFTVPQPATWWQHLKHAHAPAWMLRRRPVRYRDTQVDVSFTRWATYPHAGVPQLPDHYGAPVIVDTVSHTITGETAGTAGVPA